MPLLQLKYLPLSAPNPRLPYSYTLLAAGFPLQSGLGCKFRAFYNALSSTKEKSSATRQQTVQDLSYRRDDKKSRFLTLLLPFQGFYRVPTSLIGTNYTPYDRFCKLQWQ